MQKQLFNITSKINAECPWWSSLSTWRYVHLINPVFWIALSLRKCLEMFLLFVCNYDICKNQLFLSESNFICFSWKNQLLSNISNESKKYNCCFSDKILIFCKLFCKFSTIKSFCVEIFRKCIFVKLPNFLFYFIILTKYY